MCEPFTQWVLEDDFPTGRPPFEDAGVQFVDDVVPYELMKLRLLNASHQALCYLGYLAGYRYAHEVCQDPLFVDFLLGYMEREGSPTLPDVPGVDLGAYRRVGPREAAQGAGGVREVGGALAVEVGQQAQSTGTRPGPERQAVEAPPGRRRSSMPRPRGHEQR